MSSWIWARRPNPSWTRWRRFASVFVLLKSFCRRRQSRNSFTLLKRAIRHRAAGPQPNSPSPPSNGGEGRGEEVRSFWIAPLLDPLPTPSSRGEEGESALRKVVATGDDSQRY